MLLVITSILAVSIRQVGEETELTMKTLDSTSDGIYAKVHESTVDGEKLDTSFDSTVKEEGGESDKDKVAL